MPHALIGYAGSTLRAAQMYVETHPEDNLTVLIDYFAQEYTDALEVCRWWYHDYLPKDPSGSRTLSLRLDTHGERYAARIPGARLAVIPGVAHAPFLEDAAPPLVKSFLTTKTKLTDNL